jgi:hypothetical protein
VTEISDVAESCRRPLQSLKPNATSQLIDPEGHTIEHHRVPLQPDCTFTFVLEQLHIRICINLVQTNRNASRSRRSEHPFILSIIYDRTIPIDQPSYTLIYIFIYISLYYLLILIKSESLFHLNPLALFPTFD